MGVITFYDDYDITTHKSPGAANTHRAIKASVGWEFEAMVATDEGVQLTLRRGPREYDTVAGRYVDQKGA